MANITKLLFTISSTSIASVVLPLVQRMIYSGNDLRRLEDFFYILSQTEKDFNRNSCMNRLGEARVFSGV